MAKRGRPPRGEFSGKTRNINTRITDELRQRLEQAKKENDRSLSQEIEMRLTRSFDQEKDRTITVFGAAPTYILFRIAAETVKMVEQWTGEPWLRDRFTFEIAAAAISSVVTSFAPTGPLEPPEEFPTTPDLSEWPDLKESLRSRLVSRPISELAAPFAAIAVAQLQGAALHPGLDNEFQEIWKKAAEVLNVKLTKPVLPLADQNEGTKQ